MRPPAPRGFTLIEVVIAAAILVFLAAITVPQVMDALDKKRVEDTVDLLSELHFGITNSRQTGFMNVVRTGAAVTNSSTVPGRLSHLTEPIVAASSTNYHNSCGSAATATYSYNATAVTTWTVQSPYYRGVVSSVDGLASPIGQIQNTLVRTPSAPPTTNNPQFIQIRINNVDPNDATALDIRIDGVSNTTAGTIRITNNGAVRTVNYLIPVPQRC